MTQHAYPGPGRLNIGDVLAALKDEFPDLTHSKVRFLEKNGLVAAQRTKSGYRKFSERDVDRLRTVLRLQRDHYMPLRAIAEHLDAQDRGLEPSAPGGVPLAPEPSRETRAQVSTLHPARDVRLRRTELVASAGVQHALLTELESFGLVTVGADGFYGANDVEVLRIAAELDKYGLQPRHLRTFRVVADRQVALIEQAMTPRRRHGEDSGVAQALEEVSGLCQRLGANLFLSRLRALQDEVTPENHPLDTRTRRR